MTQARLLAPFAVLVLLLVVAGGFLAASSAGEEADEGAPAADRSLRFDERRPGPDRSRPRQLLPRLDEEPFVGVSVAEEGGEVTVEEVLPRSPGARAGIREGDVVESVDGEPVETAGDVRDAVLASERGDTLTFRLRREGRQVDIEVRVGTRSAPGGRFFLPPRDELPFFDVPELRELAGERYERFIEGRLAFLNEEGGQETVRLLAGTVVRATAGAVAVAPNGGGPEEEFTVSDETRIVRGLRRAEADDLEPGDKALIVARGDGRDASIILAVPAREGESEGTSSRVGDRESDRS